MTEEFDRKAATWDDDPARVERAAEVARQIMDRITLTPGMDVLDFGSGTGLLGFCLLPFVASVTFADPSEGMLAQVAAKLRAVGDQRSAIHHLDPAAMALPARYDVIVSLMALHHAADVATTIDFLARHLSPGGWIALCDLDTEDGTFHDDPSEHVHLGFDRTVLLALLERVGLERGSARTAYTMRVRRGSSEREYPLFLLTAQRGTSDAPGEQ